MRTLYFFLFLLFCLSCRKDQDTNCEETELMRSAAITTTFQADRIIIQISENRDFEICGPEGFCLVSTDCGKFNFYVFEFLGDTLAYTYLPTNEELNECFDSYVLKAKIQEP